MKKSPVLIENLHGQASVDLVVINRKEDRNCKNRIKHYYYNFYIVNVTGISLQQKTVGIPELDKSSRPMLWLVLFMFGYCQTLNYYADGLVLQKLQTKTSYCFITEYVATRIHFQT